MISIKLSFVLILWLSIPDTVFSNHSYQRIETLAKLVNAVVEHENVAAVLYATGCWSKSEEIKFVKSISFPVQIGKASDSIRLPVNEITNKQWFFVDMFCDFNTDFLSNVDERYFAHPYRWIIADVTNSSIESLAFLPDSYIILANEDADSERFTLGQAYKIAHGYSMNHEKYGWWSHQNGIIDLRTTRTLSRRRSNLQGHTLKASSVFMQKGAENHTDLDDYHNNKIDIVSKISLVLAAHWVETVNATMEIDVQRTWGYTDPKTGLMTGMAGQLQSKRADIGATVSFITYERIGHVEFLSMEVPSNFAFVMRSPPISYVSNIYYLPFSGVVWVSSIALVIVCTIVVAITLKIVRSKPEETENLNVSDYTLFAIASCCQMGTEILSKFLSARISMFCFFISLLFIYTSFTANVVALLQSTTKSIQTISHLQNPAIDVGVQDTPYNRIYFAAATESSRKKLFETKIEPPSGPQAYFNISYGVSLMRKGMFAYHMETGVGYNEVERTFYEHEKCGLVEIKFYNMGDLWCIVRKDLPYKEMLKVNVMKIREHGIQDRERLRFFEMRPKCDSDGKNFGSVRFNDCYAAVLILVYGNAAALLLFGIEKLRNVKIIK